MLCRGFIAAVAAYLEERGGLKLFTLDDDIPQEIPQNPIPHSGTLSEDLSSSYGDSDDKAESAEVAPHFFSQTKFFAILDLEESRELHALCVRVNLEPGEVLFKAGDPSDEGIFIVVEGQLGVYLDKDKADTPKQCPSNTNTSTNSKSNNAYVNVLRYGESVGDIDVLDGAPRSVSCRALHHGASLVQIPRDLFLRFIMARPKRLLAYVRSATARLWRVAHFMLSDYLQLPPTIVEENVHIEDKAMLQLARSISMVPGSKEGQQGMDVTPASPGLKSLLTQNESSRTSQKQSIFRKQPDDGLSVDIAEAAVQRIMSPRHSILKKSGGDQKFPRRKVSFDLNDDQMEGVAALIETERELAASPAFGGHVEVPFMRRRSIDGRVSALMEADIASCKQGWDVVAREENGLSEATWSWLRSASSKKVVLRKGQVLHGIDELCRSFYILLQGYIIVERADKSTAVVLPGGLISGGAFLTGTRTRCKASAAEHCILATFDNPMLDVMLEGLTALGSEQPILLDTSDLDTALEIEEGNELDALHRSESQETSTASFATAKEEVMASPFQGQELTLQNLELQQETVVFIDLILTATRALLPLIRTFVKLGMNRQWLRAGDTVYNQGDVAESLFVVISGRVRLLHSDPRTCQVVIEDSVARGQSVGAVWALAHGRHDSTCLCMRDTELVRLSSASFERISSLYPGAAANVLSNMAQRLAAAHMARRRPGAKMSHSDTSKIEGDLVSIALVAAGTRCDGHAMQAINKLARSLQSVLNSMWGKTLLLTSNDVAVRFPTEFEKLATSNFHRSKITSWMATQEEEYRFILLVADNTVNAWSSLCTAQADCTLLIVSDPATASHEVGELENALVWRPTRRTLASMKATVSSAQSNPSEAPDLATELLRAAALGNGWNGAAVAAPTSLASGGYGGPTLKRNELVLLYGVNESPSGTSEWLSRRPLLTRHHHIRPELHADMERLSRWMGDAAIGIVLSGGGSRGLAHLGVLKALEDTGIPIDAYGGTSQGAFCAALAAQGLGSVKMTAKAFEYASEMGSFRRLLSDITLPIFSIFHGAGFNRVVKNALNLGPQKIEDLWLNYFAVTTDVTAGQAAVHTSGVLWRMVRASMTIVGLVPPVIDPADGHLHVDGGYLNNLPVDVMRAMLGNRGIVIVVDVEDRDESAWHNLSVHDGGVSGWQLLWDRFCPIPSWRFNVRVPGYAAVMNTLTWLSHLQNLRRMAAEHSIDLYLRPPVSRYRLLDYRLAERIVRESNLYAFDTITSWKATKLSKLETIVMSSSSMMKEKKSPVRHITSAACMSQLQGKISFNGDRLETKSVSLIDDRDENIIIDVIPRAATLPPPQMMESLPTIENSIQVIEEEDQEDESDVGGIEVPFFAKGLNEHTFDDLGECAIQLEEDDVPL